MKYFSGKKLKQGKRLWAEVSKKEAFENLDRDTIVDTYTDEGEYYGSFGMVYATEVNMNRQIEDKTKNLLTDNKGD